MNVPLRRPDQQTPRVFPEVGQGLYGSADLEGEVGADARAARAVLRLATNRCSFWRRLGWFISETALLPRMLHMHRLGLQAEMEGRFHHADAYWYEVRRALATLPKEHPAWSRTAAELLLAHPGLTVLGEPEELRRRFLDEVIVDTHCALYNGRLRDDLPPDDRAYDHASHLFAMLPMLGTATHVTVELAGEPLRAKVEGHLRQKNWRKAEVLARRLVAAFP